MPRTSTWDARRPPRQEDKTFVVTGGTGGIGYFIAEQLAAAGAHVILAVRSQDKAGLAVQAIRTRVPQAQLSTVRLDLGDLSSVRSAADLINGEQRLDGIVLNAGVLANGNHGNRGETADGHESMYGTNHLGHFALTALIYPALARGDESRVVTMGSLAARSARLDLDDLESSRGRYRAFDVYKRSKLAQMMFAFELDRRARQAGSSVLSLVAHPGGALDGLTPSRRPAFARNASDIMRALPLAAAVQGKDHAAWAAVRALLDPAAGGGQLWGPRFLRSKGAPALERPAPAMTDRESAGRLWRLSEEAAGVTWPLRTSPQKR
jgi:NAD(P)-dependent dehydrogenase (short-subunit alcohol dehydrogenase family)